MKIGDRVRIKTYPEPDKVGKEGVIVDDFRCEPCPYLSVNVEGMYGEGDEMLLLESELEVIS